MFNLDCGAHIDVVSCQLVRLNSLPTVGGAACCVVVKWFWHRHWLVCTWDAIGFGRPNVVIRHIWRLYDASKTTDKIRSRYTQLHWWATRKTNGSENGLDRIRCHKFWSKRAKFIKCINSHWNISFRKLVQYDDWCSISIHVALDNMIITDEIGIIWEWRRNIFENKMYLFLL